MIAAWERRATLSFALAAPLGKRQPEQNRNIACRPTRVQFEVGTGTDAETQSRPTIRY